jgi:hypothetical protein
LEPHFGSGQYSSQPYSSGYEGQSYASDPFGDAPSSAQPYGDASETATGRPWPYDREPPAANGTGQPPAPYAPANGTGQPPAPDAPGAPGAPHAPHAPDAPGSGAATAPPWYPHAESPFPSAPSAPPAEPAPPVPSAQPSEPTAAPDADIPYPTADESYKGLPRRVRQASLAPQLRDKNVAAPAAPGDSAVPDRSPEQIRSALSAIQRGWQEGRGSSDTPPTAAGERSEAGEATDDQETTQSWPITSSTTSAEPGNEEQSHLGGSDAS